MIASRATTAAISRRRRILDISCQRCRMEPDGSVTVPDSILTKPPHFCVHQDSSARRLKSRGTQVLMVSSSVVLNATCNCPVLGTGECTIASTGCSVATDIVSCSTNVAVGQEGVKSACAFVCSSCGCN